MNNLYKWVIRIVILLLLVYGWLIGQGVRGFEGKNIYLINQPELPLTQRIHEAEKRFAQKFPGDYFLTGYLFEARSNAHTSGTYLTSEGNAVSKISRSGDSLMVHHFGSGWGEHEESPAGFIDRSVIFLHKKKGSRFEIVDVSVLTNECKYQINTLPFYWFGKIDNTESINFLKQIFRASENRAQKHLIAAIAFHDHPQALDFIYGICTGNYTTDLRKSAVFWMGVVKGKKSLDFLIKIAKNEKDFNIRKQVVFALHLNGTTGAVRELIKMAKEDDSVSLRKKAIFWLGHQASKESVKTLKEVIKGDDELTVKSSVVFAISQLPREKAVPLLIDIAKQNRSPKIRKKAIFWLGQIGDERAVEFFEKILLK